jgi:prepilin-type N-terminal cleavage/methylation domain-containing protein
VTTRADRGFSLVELLVSIAIMVAVMSGVFGFIDTGYGMFDFELEQTDMRQRLRASIDVMFGDLVMAGSRSQTPAIAPRRRGERSPDLPGSAFSDRVSVRYVASDADPADAITITYWRRSNGVDGPQLMRYDGQQSDLPVADHVESLRFDYFDVDGFALDLGRFTDGPWVPDAVSSERFDADLLQIRRVRVVLRVSPVRTILRAPLRAQEMAMELAPRNLNLP